MSEPRRVCIEGRWFNEGVRLLVIWQICGIDVPVIEGTTAQIAELVEADGSVLEGCFDHLKMCIYLRSDAPETSKRSAAAHEGVHAFILLSGLGHFAKLLLGEKRAKNWDEIEEAAVRLVEPHIVALGGFRC